MTQTNKENYKKNCIVYKKKELFSHKIDEFDTLGKVFDKYRGWLYETQIILNLCCAQIRLYTMSNQIYLYNVLYNQMVHLYLQ